MHGAAANIFWQYRPEIFGQEAPNYGLVGLDGEPTDRSRCVMELAHMHRRHADILDQLKFEESPVGLVCSPRCLAFQQVEGGAQHWQNFVGWYLALCHQGWLPRLLRDEDLAADGIPSFLRALIAPMQFIQTPELAERLATWVQQGGLLIGGPWFELYDSNLYAQRQCPGTALFGVRQSDFGRFAGLALTCLGDARSVALLPVGPMAETLFLEDAQPLAVSGHDVIVATRSFGQGRAVYVGCQPGLAYDPVLAPALGAFATTLFRSTRIAPAAYVSGGCIYRLANSPAGLVLLIVNPRKADIIAWVQIAGQPTHAFDLLTGQRLASLDQQGFLCGISMPAEDARIVLFQKPC